MPDFFELARQRQSCRKFDPERRAEKEKLLSCLEAARIAPSACNSQPRHFTVVNGPEMSPSTGDGIVEKFKKNRYN
ncbi:MAG: nitroreductase family protein [Oscillospiraceae bacterium]